MLLHLFLALSIIVEKVCDNCISFSFYVTHNFFNSTIVDVQYYMLQVFNIVVYSFKGYVPFILL